jgi:hypothetical protein
LRQGYYTNYYSCFGAKPRIFVFYTFLRISPQKIYTFKRNTLISIELIEDYGINKKITTAQSNEYSQNLVKSTTKSDKKRKKEMLQFF